MAGIFEHFRLNLLPIFAGKFLEKFKFSNKIRLESKIPFFNNSLFEELQMAKQKLLRTTSLDKAEKIDGDA